MSQTFDPYHKWLGIRPEEQPPNHYRLLGLQDFENDPAAIENAAHQRMVYLKTLQAGKHADQSQQLLNEVVAAKLCLLDIDAKTDYDARLRQRFTGAGPPRNLRVVAAVPAVPSPLAAREEPVVFERPAEIETPSNETGSVGRFPAAIVLSVAGAVAVGAVLVAFAGSLLWKYMDRHEGPTVTRTYTPPPPVAADTAEPEPSLGEDAESEEKETADTSPDGISQSDDAATDQPGRDSEPDEPPPPVEPDEEDADHVETTPSDRPIPADERLETDGSHDTPPVIEQPPDVRVAARLPLPAPDTQREITTRLEELYPPASYTSSTKKVDLARELLQLGRETPNSDDERFVLYRRAMEVACEGGDTAIMIAAIREIGADFDVDTRVVKTKMLQRYVGDGDDPQRVLGFLKSAQQLVAEAMADRQLQLALEVSAAACRFCDRPIGGSDFRQSIRDDHVRIEKTLRAYEAFTRARERLATTPDDPQANLDAGRWYCLVQDGWEQGLPCLARSGDERLQAIARTDLSVAVDRVESVMDLADAWWELAQARTGDEQIAFACRARHWYESIPLSKLSGIQGMTIQTRRGEIADLLAKSEPSLWRDTDQLATDGPVGPDNDASQGDFRTTFTRGVVAVQKDRDYRAAERWFAVCVKMQTNHVPSLNNLALTCVRNRDYRRAIHMWEQAVELAPQRTELGRNLARFRKLSDDDDFTLEPSLRRSLNELCAKVTSSGRYVSGAGWLYLPVDGSASYGNTSYEDDRCMHCGGAGDVNCPARGCARGRVRSTRTEVVGRNSITGQSILKSTPIRVTCGHCRGRGKVDCPHCSYGKARGLY